MTSERDALTAIGLGVAHSLWVGALIAAWAGVSLRLLGPARPGGRHAVAMAALAAIAGVWLLASIGAAHTGWSWPRWVGLAWMAGAAVGGIRLVNSLRMVRGLRARAQAAGAPWQGRLRAVAAAIGVTRHVPLGESADIEVPCSLGVWRPAILMPAGELDEMSEAGFRAIVAHELAHIKRADYAWNLAQRSLELVLFFHPARPWLSRVIQRERERCCDELAGAACDPVELARGFAEVEARRADLSMRALVSDDQPLLDRVRHLVDRADAGNVGGRWSPAAVTAAVCASGAALLCVTAWGTGLGAGVSAPAPGPWLAAAGLGLLVGMRHAFEPDHLMAVATLVSRERSVGAAARLGASWGVGHSVSLLAAGSLLTVLRVAMPMGVATLLEAVVAVMIATMGVRALRESRQLASGGPSRWHAHGGSRHMHPASGEHIHIGPWALARRPLLVGVVHGLAGSGALTALALASLPTLTAQVGFILVFGLGSAAGMAGVAGIAGWPVARLVQTRFAMASLTAATGAAAVVFGMAWGMPLLRHLVQG